MTCDCCATRGYIYRNGCDGCVARGIARTPVTIAQQWLEKVTSLNQEGAVAMGLAIKRELALDELEAQRKLEVYGNGT